MFAAKTSIVSISMVCVLMSACTPYAASTPASATSARSNTSASTGDDEEFPLAERAPIAGASASLRAPLGSEAMPQGGGFVHTRRRIQLIVIASEGPEWVHQQTLASVSAGSEEISRETIELMGKPAELVIDTQDTGGLALERVRVFVHDGTRSVLAIGGYAAERSERLRGLVRASVQTLEWDASEPLDPESTLHARLVPSAPLALSRRSTSVLRYETTAQSAIDPTAHPAPTLSVFPVQVSASEQEGLSHCAEMLRGGIDVSEENVISSGTVTSSNGARGCELRATQTIPHPSGPAFAAHTYAAVLWSSGRSFLVMGMAPDTSGESEVWMNRFAENARTLAADALPSNTNAAGSAE